MGGGGEEEVKIEETSEETRGRFMGWRVFFSFHQWPLALQLLHVHLQSLGRRKGWDFSPPLARKNREESVRA